MCARVCFAIVPGCCGWRLVPVLRRFRVATRLERRRRMCSVSFSLSQIVQENAVVDRCDPSTRSRADSTVLGTGVEYV